MAQFEVQQVNVKTILGPTSSHCIATMPSSLSSLSIELIQSIFFLLPDINSLQSFALTCRLTYNAFLGCPSPIYSVVLSNELGPDIFEWTLRASASRNHLRSKEQICDFLSHYVASTRKGLSQPSALKGPEALRLREFHQHIVFFTSLLCSSVSNRQQIMGDTFTVQTPSATERVRIQRVLYTFEVFCNLFGRQPDEKPGFGRFPDLQKHFFTLFEPWENEQLACIHDFLVGCIMDACTTHDTFSDIDPDDLPEMFEFFQRHYLSLGLERLRTILDPDVSNEDGIRNLLASSRKTCSDFLKDVALEEIDTKPYQPTAWDGGAMDMNDRGLEDDQGPRQIWSAVYSGIPWYFMDYAIWYRAWAYCFWDRRRLIRILKGDIGVQIKKLNEYLESVNQEIGLDMDLGDGTVISKVEG